MATSFVPLRLRSRYTLLGGTMPAAKLGAHLKTHGFAAGVLLDRGNLRGALEFYEGCLAEGVSPLIGAELACPITGRHAGLVALSRQGYANLCEVVSRVNLDGRLPLLDVIRSTHKGLAVLSPDSETALALAEGIGKERVWLDIIANRDRAASVRAKLEFARRNGLRATASWDALHLDRADRRVSQVLVAIADGKTLESAPGDAQDPSLAAALGLDKAFAGEPEVLRESLRLAEMADLRLELGVPHFPCLTASPEESLRRLEAACSAALPGKYPAGRYQARRRLAEELRVVGKLGLADYFLVVADIVGFAANRRIPMTGRGSGASSLVAYLLGITQADPISEGLIFERFLSELRQDYPDLDIDVSWKRRDEVIDYVYKRFGSANVAMISTHACFEARLAAREVAKAFGLSPYEAQSLADRLPYHGSGDLAGAIARALGAIKPELALDQRSGIADLAGAIVGFPNHTSIHCGGIVVSDRPITYYTPLEMAAKGIQVTQFDMHSIEKIGLVKIDLLGNRALSVIEEAVKESAGADPHCRASKAFEGAPDGGRTAAILRCGRTLSCFQLESPAMRNLLGMMKAETRADATLALALVRPGPAAGGMKQQFISRRRAAAGRSDRGTADLPVYEEDVMRLIAAFTGGGLAEADVFRRSLKEGGADEELEAKFLFMADTVGLGGAAARQAWAQIRRFARYTFSKAHAASFGVLAYATAYLKANFPLEFYAAVFRNHSGMYPLWVHVNEARRLGIGVLPPSINRSAADFAIEGEAIRTGLTSVRHLSHATVDLILTERSLGSFCSLWDLVGRVPAGKDEILSLVASGAFDELEPDRCAVLTGYLAMRGKVGARGTPRLAFAEDTPTLAVRDFTPLEERRMEYAALGFSPLVHPLEFFDSGGAAAASTGPAAATTVCGLVAALRHYHDKSVRLWFVSLDNPEGIHEAIVPEGVPAPRLEIGDACVADGMLQRRFGVATLKVRALRPLPERPSPAGVSPY